MQIEFHKDAREITLVECTMKGYRPVCRHRGGCLRGFFQCTVHGKCKYKRVWKGFVQPVEDKLEDKRI